LPCGGAIEVFLARVERSLVERMCEARANRSRVVRVSDIVAGAEEVWAEGEPSSIVGIEPEGLAAVSLAIHRERSQLLEIGGRRLFVHVVAAPLRLVIVGAVHLTQALVDLARPTGIDVIVVDPRTAFANEDRFPGIRLVHEWPDVALAGLGLDRRTALVVLSHDAKLDEPALEAALRSECFYIGALGSQKTQRARRGRLAESGFDEAQLARIHGPIGLDIGALTTPEIAISIMAELIRNWRGRPSPEAAASAPAAPRQPGQGSE
jgi:xanthine dehydrogenase accessory factor